MQNSKIIVISDDKIIPWGNINNGDNHIAVIRNFILYYYPYDGILENLSDDADCVYGIKELLKNNQAVLANLSWKDNRSCFIALPENMSYVMYQNIINVLAAFSGYEIEIDYYDKEIDDLREFKREENEELIDTLNRYYNSRVDEERMKL